MEYEKTINAGLDSTKCSGEPSKTKKERYALIVSALCKHHKYDHNTDAFNNHAAVTDEIKDLSGIEKARISEFFRDQFDKKKNNDKEQRSQGYTNYKRLCEHKENATQLLQTKLKALREEYFPNEEKPCGDMRDESSS